MKSDQKETAKKQLIAIFEDAFKHDGFSDFKVEMKILKRQQKEVIIHYGKQYRYVLDFKNSNDILNNPVSETRKLAGVDR